MISTRRLILLLVLYMSNGGETSHNHYTTQRSNTNDNNVYITDKYGQVVAVEPYWSRSAKSYPAPFYTRRCYNCVSRNVYYTDPYTRRVYLKDQFGNSVLVNPDYSGVVYPSYRKGGYYYDWRKYSSGEDYVYVNDMYGRTRAVPKSRYLYEYAKGY